MPLERQLHRAVLEEILAYTGAPVAGIRRWFLELLLIVPAARFAAIACRFESQVETAGFCGASRWLLAQFTPGYRATGLADIPQSGPLILAANHPGTFDTFLIAACAQREDIKIIARSMPLLQLMESTRASLILSTRDPHVKMAAARSAIRHLHAGGALLVYPTGTLDPDPDSMDGALQAVERWSGSVELLLRSEPHARLQVVTTSGLLQPGYLRHPLARLQKNQRGRQIIAEILQLSFQFVFQTKLKQAPRITFSEQYPMEALASGGKTLGMGVREAAKACLRLHQSTPSSASSIKVDTGSQPGQERFTND